MKKEYTAIETFDTREERLDRAKVLDNKYLDEVIINFIENIGRFKDFDKFLLEYKVMYD